MTPVRRRGAQLRCLTSRRRLRSRAPRLSAGVRRTWPSFNAELDQVLADVDVRAIQRLQKRWLDEELAGHSASILDLCTEDVVWMPPAGLALRGKAVVQAWLNASSVQIEDICLSNVRIDGQGLVAYKVADYQTRWIPAGSSHPVTSDGSHLWVLRRRTDSTWSVALVAWSSCDDKGEAV